MYYGQPQSLGSSIELAETNYSHMVTVAQTVLTSGSSAISITGLDLDTDRNYIILLDGVPSGTAGWDNISMHVNSDTTTTNYAYQNYQVSNTTFTGARANSNIIASLYTAIPFNYMINISKYTGKIPTAWSKGISRADVSNITTFDFAWLWTGTANVTSITFTNSETFAAGTRITVLKVS